MMKYIKSQAVSDEAEPTISTVFIIAFVVVAAVWIFPRILTATERKAADISNCIASSSNLAGATSGTIQNNACNDKNSNGHTYNYGAALDNK